MRLLVVTLLSLSFCLAQAQAPDAVKAYVERYKAIAIEEMKSTGIPASVTLAQGIHESGCGMSVLAQRSNNHFGIKCHEEWTGNKYHHDDDQPQECFRVYNTPEESFKDHSDFLKTRSRYANLFKLESTDYAGWARGLKAAGYATNPQYPQIIIRLIEDYNLNRFDNPNTADAPATAQVSKPKKDKKTDEVVALIQQSLVAQASSTVVEPVKEIKPVPTIAEQPQFTFDERIVNGTRAVIFKKGLPLPAIAQKYELSMEQLLSYNDLSPSTAYRIKDNEMIYVQPKKPESSYYQYEIAEGETMRDVAQKFGVVLSELYKRNGIRQGCEPLSGEVIVLRGKREVALKYRVLGRTTVETYTPGDANKVHTVESSETLYSISKQYKIPVEELKKANNLEDDNIHVGQTLVVDL